MRCAKLLCQMGYALALTFAPASLGSCSGDASLGADDKPYRDGPTGGSKGQEDDSPAADPGTGGGRSADARAPSSGGIVDAGTPSERDAEVKNGSSTGGADSGPESAGGAAQPGGAGGTAAAHAGSNAAAGTAMGDACDTEQCSVPHQCLESCGGPVVVENTCCPCPTDTVDAITCVAQTDGSTNLDERATGTEPGGATDTVVAAQAAPEGGTGPSASERSAAESLAAGGSEGVAQAGVLGEPECIETGDCTLVHECVEVCGGPVVRSGCCPCPDGTIDHLTCG